MSDGYEIESLPPAPGLTGSVVVRASADELVDAIAADFLVHAINCIRTFGDFHVALSGGSTPIPFYQRLMYDPSYRAIPWQRAHLWIVDERRVPFDDDRSNFRSISEIIVDHSGIPSEQVHPIFAQAPDADTAYEALLRETLGWREPGHDRLDYVLLGMGSDGHTASLFPNSGALKEELREMQLRNQQLSGARVEGSAKKGDVPKDPGGRLVRINSGENVTPPDRVTMTLRLLNASRFIAVMVTGKSKREMLKKVVAAPKLVPPELIEEIPILGIRPLAGELRWYVDSEACPE
ncbi:MAG: 6-phosphogluconolactonase [Pyrinomonadaceae bacterium]|nr:6-phosphogluconolactonase [Phycisphaerales bacterium]